MKDKGRSDGRNEAVISPPGDPLACLNAQDLAHLLTLSAAEVRKMAGRGELPGAFRVGRRWLFHRASVQAWLDTRTAPSEPARRQPTTTGVRTPASVPPPPRIAGILLSQPASHRRQGGRK